jgi:ubiquitin-protein ligase
MPTDKNLNRRPATSLSQQANMSNTKRILTEFKSLKSEADSLKMTVSCSEETLNHWTATITGATETPYDGLIYKLQIEFPSNYPFSPPKIKFTNGMFHPNVDAAGDICLDILKDKWTPVLNVTKALLSILAIMAEPNPSSALNMEAATLYTSNMTEYKAKVKQSIQPLGASGPPA